MSNELRQLLIVQRLDMTENYYNWYKLFNEYNNIFNYNRKKNVLLQKLATVIGLKDYYDPDPSYVITVDNIMKMMAILMRFRLFTILKIQIQFDFIVLAFLLLLWVKLAVERLGYLNICAK